MKEHNSNTIKQEEPQKEQPCRTRSSNVKQQEEQQGRTRNNKRSNVKQGTSRGATRVTIMLNMNNSNINKE